MKKLIILAVLLLGMVHTAFAEQRGVLIEIHYRSVNGKNMSVNRAPMRLPIEVVYDSDTHKIKVSGDNKMEVQLFLCDENGNTLDYSQCVNSVLNIPNSYSGLITLRIESEGWIAIGNINV